MQTKKKLGSPILACVFLVLMLLLLGRAGCRAIEEWRMHGSTEGAVIELTATEYHTQADVDAALADFQVEFQDLLGCTLNRLWYEEAWAAPLEQSRADSYGEGRENWLLLLADMQTGSYWEPERYESNTHYMDYCFILRREGKSWSLVEAWPRTEPERPFPAVVTPTPEPTKSPNEQTKSSLQ